MPSYSSKSRFSTDDGFKVLTRKGVTIGTVTIMPVPVRGPNDSQYIVPLNFQYRWDLLANALLGDPNDKWILMRHNRIEDPFVGPLAGDRLLVPTVDQIAYYRNQSA